MSATSYRSYKTESKTDTADTGTTEDKASIPDRWSHIITYEQLVLSSCVGIAQLWWHPYIHDISKLLPFMFVYNVFSVTVGYPIFYLELGLGAITKKSCIDCWDIAPIARGIGISVTMTALFTALSLSAAAAHALALLVHALHGFLPWLQCAARAEPPCAPRHRPFANGSDTPPQSFFFNFVVEVERGGARAGGSRPVWELAAYFAISWTLVYLVCVRRIYSYSKLVLFKDVLIFFVLLSAGAGAARLDGAGRMFSRCDWSVLFNDITIWSDALQYALLEMSVCQGSVVMLGGRSPGSRLGVLALAALALSKLASTASSLVLGAVHGALADDYHSDSVNLWGGASASLVLWADWAARTPGSQFWAMLVFFTLFVAAITSVALAVITVLSVFSGRSLRKISWAFLILICFLLALIGFLTLCTQSGLHTLNTLLTWAVARARVPSAALLAAAITCVYGQKTFCEEVFFQTGEYPWLYHRVCWAVAPPLIMIIFLADTTFWLPDALGLVTLVVTFAPGVFLLIFYLCFKCRVRNMVREM